MPLLVGALLALAVGALGTIAGMDRDRAFYPVVTFAVASYYVLFAVMGASSGIVMIESSVCLVFIAAAVAGFKSSLWIVMAALAGHGIFDLFHGSLISNPGVPEYWPNFCMAFDVLFAGVLGMATPKRKDS
ncbi:MAG: hypothetical protein IPH59_02250 [bacterium]|nr:hypothetical protein [bacterium]